MIATGTALGIIGPFFWPTYKFVALSVVLLGVLSIAIADAINDQIRTELIELRKRDAEREADLVVREGELRSAIANNRKMAKILLRAIASDLNFGEGCRVNLYKLDHVKLPSDPAPRPVFTRVARYSKHATFDTEGRTVYPFDQGVIRKAWDDGFYHDEIPHPSKHKKYFKYQEKHHGIPLATLQKLRMLPRGIAAIRIDTQTGTPVGLVCFESVDANKLNDDLVKQVTQDYEALLLAAAEHHVALANSGEEGL